MRALAAATLLLAATPALADTIFDAARKPGQRVVLTLAESSPSTEDLAGPPMLSRTLGVLGELKGKQIAELMEAVDPHAAAVPAPDASPVCFVHIGLGSGAQHIRVLQQPDGSYIAEPISSPASPESRPTARRSSLRPERFDRLLAGAGPYLGGFGAAEVHDPVAKPFDVPKPYHHGAATLDSRSIQDRLGASGYIRFDPVHIDLSKELFVARLPQGYHPEQPAGLLVWMDPTGAGRPPEAFAPALDRLNIVCIGAAGAGNDRGVTDRLQLALDAAATAQRRWHIDPRRVYVAGASGGAKMATILMPCFPDVFDGAVAIVGLASWHPVPTGEGARIWPAEFTRPKERLWRMAREHRLAAVTGSNDFNHQQILKTLDRMKGEGPATRLFDADGIGHELPRPDAFGDQLGWVDEPASQAASTRETEAAAALDKLGKQPDTRELNRIIERWPWTPASWRALELLRPATSPHEPSGTATP